ncbi:energy transducer TonB [Geopsychrobacter electrodiphilus]|uniref:energy transducer TonB n=1 Tax=Geopsychrobacter electrodiphilus TaxID=225196 RepID=UPI00146B24AC|nr:energy transducer TonB [Geopsychrobacter electrodiphilus]
MESPLLTHFGAANGPRVLGSIRPVYPLHARRLGREGRVVLRLRLSRTGQLQSAEVVESAGYGFDESALAAVRRAKFVPASTNNQPVACEVLLPVRFHLESR